MRPAPSTATRIVEFSERRRLRRGGSIATDLRDCPIIRHRTDANRPHRNSAMNTHTFDKLAMARKIAVVTGGTQGLGEAIAHLFAERGAEGLVICGRNRANGERVKSALEKKGARAVYVE